jgi:hypothetical protein
MNHQQSLQCSPIDIDCTEYKCQGDYQMQRPSVLEYRLPPSKVRLKSLMPYEYVGTLLLLEGNCLLSIYYLFFPGVSKCTEHHEHLYSTIIESRAIWLSLCIISWHYSRGHRVTAIVHLCDFVLQYYKDGLYVQV